MLRHIALQVKENDIQGFYTEILGGKILHQFTLNEGDAKSLFQISGQIEVCRLSLNNLEFELFIHDNIEKDCLQHLCLEMKGSKDIYSKAKEKGYWTRIRNSGDNDTYFIRDQNRNMFEIKTKPLWTEPCAYS